jgi:hypothetical protein
VLLKRADRHDKHPPRPRLNIWPVRGGQREPGVPRSGW